MVHGNSPNSVAFIAKGDLCGNCRQSSRCRNKVRRGRLDGQFRYVERGCPFRCRYRKLAFASLRSESREEVAGSRSPAGVRPRDLFLELRRRCAGVCPWGGSVLLRRCRSRPESRANSESRSELRRTRIISVVRWRHVVDCVAQFQGTDEILELDWSNPQ
jgi:hypothetical protein